MTADHHRHTPDDEPTISRADAQRELGSGGFVYRADDGRILTYGEAFDELTPTMAEGLAELPAEEQVLDGGDFEEFVWESGVYTSIEVEGRIVTCYSDGRRRWTEGDLREQVHPAAQGGELGFEEWLAAAVRQGTLTPVEVLQYTGYADEEAEDAGVLTVIAERRIVESALSDHGDRPVENTGGPAEEVVYTITHRDGFGDDAPVLERVELCSIDGELWVRDFDGGRTRCGSADAVTVITELPRLNEIRSGQQFRIVCSADIAAELPLLLEPTPDDGAPGDYYGEVNGQPWGGYAAVGGGSVILPVLDDMEPELSPCWASYREREGAANPLYGDTAIGLGTPAVVVEAASYDHGGFGGGRAVEITPFADLAGAIVEWLLGRGALSALWEGDSTPGPGAVLFDEAAIAADRTASWEVGAGPDDPEEGDDEEGAAYSGAGSLALYLSDDQVAQVRARLSTDARYVALMSRRERSATPEG